MVWKSICGKFNISFVKLDAAAGAIKLFKGVSVWISSPLKRCWNFNTTFSPVTNLRSEVGFKEKSLWVLICVVSNVKVTQRYAKLYQLNHPSLQLTRLHKAFCETPVLPMRSTFTVSYEQHFIFMSLYLAIPRKVSHSLTLAGMEVLLLKPPPLMKMWHDSDSDDHRRGQFLKFYSCLVWSLPHSDSLPEVIARGY